MGLIREKQKLAKTIKYLNVLLSSANNKNLIAELAFLKSYTTFTVFLESALMTAVLSSKQVTYISARDEEHARDLLAYVRRDDILTHPQDACALADKIFQDRHPFLKKLKLHSKIFGECKTIRNFIAHDSSSSRSKFEELVRQKVPGGYLPTAIKSAGDFLLYTTPQTGMTYLTNYLTVMLEVADTAEKTIKH